MTRLRERLQMQGAWRPRSVEDLLWNWARWCWAGHTVGNMAPYVSYEDDYRPILEDDARVVDQMHRALPHHEGMIVTAEYPQRNVRFGSLDSVARRQAAMRWIYRVTGVHVSDQQYQMYLGFFEQAVARRLL